MKSINTDTEVRVVAEVKYKFNKGDLVKLIDNDETTTLSFTHTTIGIEIAEEDYDDEGVVSVQGDTIILDKAIDETIKAGGVNRVNGYYFKVIHHFENVKTHKITAITDETMDSLHQDLAAKTAKQDAKVNALGIEAGDVIWREGDGVIVGEGVTKVEVNSIYLNNETTGVANFVCDNSAVVYIKKPTNKRKVKAKQPKPKQPKSAVEELYGDRFSSGLENTLGIKVGDSIYIYMESFDYDPNNAYEVIAVGDDSVVINLDADDIAAIKNEFITHINNLAVDYADDTDERITEIQAKYDAGDNGLVEEEHPLKAQADEIKAHISWAEGLRGEKYATLTKKEDIIACIKDAAKLSAGGDPNHWVALDFETTSLSPKTGIARLCSLSNGINAVLDFGIGVNNCFKEVAKHFVGGNYVVFNVCFESSWFYDARCNPNLWDSSLLRRAKLGGGSFSLATAVYDDLSMQMNKDTQSSNWSAHKLTQEQYDYSYFDAVVTRELWLHLIKDMDKGHWRAFKLLNSLYPAVMEMQGAGLLLNKERHIELVAKWCKIRDARVDTISDLLRDEDTGEIPVDNYNSGQQWSKYFKHLMDDGFIPKKVIRQWAKTKGTKHLGIKGTLSMESKVLKPLAAAWATNPMGELLYALLDYKKVSKYISTYGETLIDKANNDDKGRIYPNYNIAYAITGRFTSSQPNAQNFPRDGEMVGEHVSVRESFIAPQGRKMISLDYTGIELRVAALLAGDEALLHDAIYGDTHTEMATVMAKRPIDKNKPEDKMLRSQAKGGTFALLYGGGATGVANNMKLSTDEGANFIQAFANRYPEAYNMRYEVAERANRDGFIRLINGMTIYPTHDTRTDDGAFSVPVCANYPVQSAAFVVMAWAIINFKKALDYYRRQGEIQSARFIATIHDQLIAESSDADAPRVLALMEQCMTMGFTKVFPDASIDNLVEGGVGQSWGELS